MSIADLELILTELTRAAHFFQQKNGEFYPFGVVLKLDGSVAHQATWDGDDRPPATDVIAALEQVLRLQADKGEIKAAGICLDVRIRRPELDMTDAIQFHLEHAEGEALSVFQPYANEGSGSWKYGELIVEARDRRFFATAPHD